MLNQIFFLKYFLKKQIKPRAYRFLNIILINSHFLHSPSRCTVTNSSPLRYEPYGLFKLICTYFE